MSDMDSDLVEPFRRLLEDVCTPAAIRSAEVTPGVPPMWQAIDSSGFLDALLAEAAGGAGLSLAAVFPLVVLSGEYALPAPFAETMVARALIAARGGTVPDGAVIVLAPPSPVLPLAAAATHALVPRGESIVLLALPSGSGDDPFRASAGAIDPAAPVLLSMAAHTVDLGVFAAGLTAAKMAGAMARLLAMALRYADEREQFGRPLGKFQAIQHQLAVMAEQVVSAHVAARIGMASPHFEAARVAAAKTRAGEAATQVCAIAHAVHGAMGATEEFDLQLYTRRLKQWQLAFGGESTWARRLGAARLGADDGTTADFLRLTLADG